MARVADRTLNTPAHISMAAAHEAVNGMVVRHDDAQPTPADAPSRRYASRPLGWLPAQSRYTATSKADVVFAARIPPVRHEMYMAMKECGLVQGGRRCSEAVTDAAGKCRCRLNRTPRLPLSRRLAAVLLNVAAPPAAKIAGMRGDKQRMMEISESLLRRRRHQRSCRTSAEISRSLRSGELGA